MELIRRKFQGVLNILSFNRHFYFAGLLTLALIITILFLFKSPDYIFWIIVISFLYGLLMPLLVSAYVYDFSGFYKFDWLDKQISDAGKIKVALNINAGFDETSFIIKSKIPGMDLAVYDFYDPKRHTEPAIRRARKVSLAYPNTSEIKTSRIPQPDNSADIIFLLSAVHEIRNHGEKILFLKECRRVCKPGGRIVMVEHLRDLPNFLAFTIGFTHFFSRNVWKNAFQSAGFSNVRETKFTPFMSVFNCT